MLISTAYHSLHLPHSQNEMGCLGQWELLKKQKKKNTRPGKRIGLEMSFFNKHKKWNLIAFSYRENIHIINEKKKTGKLKPETAYTHTFLPATLNQRKTD